jgi:hypothetical protein
VSDSVRVLAMDHFFAQDLDALEAHPLLEVRRFPYQRLRGPAIRMMGAAVASGLHAYNRPSLAPARERYGAWLVREVRRLYLERAFDVMVIPSDTFFYVRSLPAAAHRLGLPVVVVQKETTISADTMEAHSAEMRGAAPFIADLMTVCSERHRQFWLRAGAPPERIEVTGQPRFDVYASPAPRRTGPRRRVLFLGYQLDAYVPGVGQGAGLTTWGPLRDETEAVLLEAARSGSCEVLVKCHPQQDHRVERARWERASGATWGRTVVMADVDADTRQLILDSDLVVGFQTTALYEAAAAGRSVIYAAWGTEYDRCRASLVPFEEAPAGCLRHATSATELRQLLASEPGVPRPGCRSWYEEALGPVDGLATDRVAQRLGAVAADWPPGAARLGLEARRRPYARVLLIRALAAEAAWTAAIPVAQLAGERRRVGIRRRRARAQRALATATLRSGSRGDAA